MKNSIVILVLFISSSLVAQNKKWKLQECVSHALENNISIKMAQNSILSAHQDIKSSKGNFLPSVSASASQGLSFGTNVVAKGVFLNRRSHSTSFGIGASQSIFNGFRNTYLYKQSKLNLERNNLELARIKDDVSLNVVNSYLNVLFNKENLEIANAQYDFSKKQLSQIKSLVEAGTQPRANIYDIEATVSRDEQKITTSENNFNLALLSLAQLLQVPYEKFDIEYIKVNTPSETLQYNNISPILSYALKNRNEIKIAEKNIETSHLNTKISKSGYLPSVSLGYNFGANAFFSNLRPNKFFLKQLNENKGHSLSLSARIPIFSNFRNSTAVSKSKIQEKNSLLRLEQAKLSLETNIQRSFAEAQADYKAYVAANKTLASQELAFNNSQERYQLGNMTLLEMEQSRVRLINAQSSLTIAKYNFIFKTKILDFYIGKPLVENK